MIISVMDKKLERFESAVKGIANTFTDHLHNGIMFEFKLQIVKVFICRTSSTKTLTCGLCGKKGNTLQVFFFINEKNPDDYIYFVIAHELAHLLLKKMTDLLSVTGRANDDSTELTSIVRITSDSKQYGRELEEQVCDIIALFILNKMGITEFSDFMIKDLKKTARKRAIVEKFISIFGSSLNGVNYIDDYDELDDGRSRVKNDFLYCAVTFGLAHIVNLYDEVMGQNAYQNFCNMLESNNIKALNSELSRFESLYK